MPNVIKQIVKDGDFGTQTIKMIVRDNERGPQGEQGESGQAATIAAGQAYVLEYGKQPQVMNSGTSSDAVFDFYIPEGKPGAIHYYAGPGINITEDNRIEATGEVAVYWGDLVGSINNQTDLKNILDKKVVDFPNGGYTITTTSTAVNILVPGKNLLNGTTSSQTIALPAATDSKAGIIAATDYAQINTNKTNIATKLSSSNLTVDSTLNKTVTGSGTNTAIELGVADSGITATKLDKASVLDLFYPIGTYYETSNTSFDPNVTWGGTWVEDTNGRVTVAYDNTQTEFNTVSGTGGEKTHTLIEAELPSITGTIGMHSGNSGTNISAVSGHFTTNTSVANNYRDGGTAASGAASCGDMIFSFGSGNAHNNLQPYVVVKRWHRTA